MSKDFSSKFWANNENKANLNIFLAKKFVDFHKNSSQVFSSVVKRWSLQQQRIRFYRRTHRLLQCGRGGCEVDSTWNKFLKQGNKNILIRTVDSDVLLFSIDYANKRTENGTEFINVNLVLELDAKTYDVIQLRDMIGHH